MRFPAPRISFEPRKYRVSLPKSAPGKYFLVRQLRRYEWMTLQRLNAPPHELERILLRIALISPSVDSLDSLWAGVATVLARLILQLSYIDTDETIQAMHVWSERQFDSPELVSIPYR